MRFIGLRIAIVRTVLDLMFELGIITLGDYIEHLEELVIAEAAMRSMK